MTTATEIVNLTDADLRAYCVERTVRKYGEGEREASIAMFGAMSRAQMLGEISIDFEGKEEKVIMKAIKLCRTRNDMRQWHSGAND